MSALTEEQFETGRVALFQAAGIAHLLRRLEVGSEDVPNIIMQDVGELLYNPINEGLGLLNEVEIPKEEE